MQEWRVLSFFSTKKRLAPGERRKVRWVHGLSFRTGQVIQMTRVESSPREEVDSTSIQVIRW